MRMMKFFAMTAMWVMLYSISFGATYGGGLGTSANPYQIWTPAQMNTIGGNSADWGKCFKLMADIDMSVYIGTQYNVIGTYYSPFTGTFDGNWHIIQNLTYNGNSRQYVGLFGYTSNAIITKLGLTNVNITSSCSDNYVGSIAGYSSSGSITNCYSRGAVAAFSTYSYAGGLTGATSSMINCCYSTCTVNSNHCSGGLVGIQWSNTISNCYTAGIVNISLSEYSVGGLVSSSFGTIVNCYSRSVVTGGQFNGGLVGAGTDAAVINSFWDIQASGTTNSSGGKGRNTFQMKQITNYIGWNSESSVWVLDEVNDYPHLAWEGSMGTALPVHVISDYISGGGTIAYPYRITTAQQLNIIGLFPAAWDKIYFLNADIDLSEFTGVEFNRIGCPDIPFNGIFDGSNYIISNLTYQTAGLEWNVGLFGYISNATIRNLGLVNVNISTKGSNIGGLVGYQNSGTINNCYVVGSITALPYSREAYAGGLVGVSTGTINECYAMGTVSANTISQARYEYACAGGLTGKSSGMISGCYTACTVSASSITSYSLAGGLAGWQDSGIICNCYTMGDVNNSSAYTSYAGGLVGYQYGYLEKIENCYSIGKVTGSCYQKGGLVGYRDVNNGTVTNSFWDTQTSGHTFSAGGTGISTEKMKTISTFTLAGWDFLFETTNGTRDIWSISSDHCPYLAWQIGMAPPNIAHVPDVVSITRVNAENAITKAGFIVWSTNIYSDMIAAGTVISQGSAADTILIRGMVVNIEVSLGPNNTGSGTEADPYRVGTITDWQALMTTSGNWDKHFILIDDLDLRGVSLTPIGNDTIKFKGFFNGAGHALRNVNIPVYSVYYAGLFGWVDSGGQISNLGIESAEVKGIYYTGGLVGENYGSISNCYVIGNVSGSYYVGGLIGQNSGAVNNCYATGMIAGSPVGGLIGYNYGGTVINCYATGMVSGGSSVGGLIGYNSSGSISDCYSTGTISGNHYAGGLIGYNDAGTVNNCYSAGSVTGALPAGGLIGYKSGGSVTNSFWDIQTSGQSTSYGGIEKTAAEMKTLLTFTSTGWDFTNETANGTNNLWRMCSDGIDYPRLNWESVDGDFACPDGVSIEDLDYFVGRWLLENCTFSNNYCSGADVDFSGGVDLADFAVLAGHWLEGISL